MGKYILAENSGGGHATGMGAAEGATTLLDTYYGALMERLVSFHFISFLVCAVCVVCYVCALCVLWFA